MKVLKKLKKFFTKEAVILALIVLILSISVQFYINGCNKKDDVINKENKILQIDEYNLGIACLTMKSIANEGEIPFLQYDINMYKENLDFVNTLSRSTQMSILKNMAWMNSSNMMMRRNALSSSSDDQKEKMKNNLLEQARDVIRDIKGYDARLSEIECDL